jgi:hypothetical protein
VPATDTVAPARPTIGSFSTDTGTAGDHITNDNTLTLSGTAEAGNTVKIYDGATPIGNAVASGSGAWSYTTAALANGGHSLTATATDAAGNTGTASAALAVTVDTTVPTKPVITGSQIMNSNILTLSGTAEAGSAVKLYDGTTFVGNAVASGSGTWSYATGALANGSHSLTATATDVAGNTSAASVALAATIDAVPPVALPSDTTAPTKPTIASISTDTGIAGDHITNDTTLTLTGSAEAGSTVKLYDGTRSLGIAVASGTGAWSCTTAALSNGGHNLTATATDAAGNTGAASTALAVTIDATSPTKPTSDSFSSDTGVAGDHITNDNTLTLTGTAEANSTVKLYDGAALLGNAVASGTGAWSYTTAALANGGHSLAATATDAAGNTGAASSPLAVTVDTSTSTHRPDAASGSIDLWTLGLTDDHIVRTMIHQIVAQAFDRLPEGTKRALVNHGVDADALHAKAVGGLSAGDASAPHLLVGTQGHENLVGGAHVDVLVAGNATHTMTGMGGPDTFVIGTRHVDVTITDFTPGVDKLEFVNSGRVENRQVQIRQENGDAVVTAGDNHVVLTNVDVHHLQPHDLTNLLV